MFKKVFKFIKKQGLRSLIFEVIRKILFLPPEKNKSAKKKAFELINSKFGDEIAYGPFKGMLYKQSWWGGYDRVSKVLGVYEFEVLKKLAELLNKNENYDFVDIGAADGYYSIGFAYSGHAKKVHAFEISEKGQEIILLNSKINKCIEKVSIYGEASIESITDIIKKCNGKAIFLIDIEGEEYKLLSDELLYIIRNSYIIIELHPFLVDQGLKKETELISRVNKLFSVSRIYKGSYNPNQFEFFNLFSDDERLLALSEGRAKNPKWLFLSPKI